MFEIEKGVPLPQERARYPFGDMEVGDSIKVDSKRGTIAARVYGYNKDKKFSYRKDGSGYRIWRVA